MPDQLGRRAREGERVDAAVMVEASVLGGDQRLWELGSHVRQADAGTERPIARTNHEQSSPCAVQDANAAARLGASELGWKGRQGRRDTERDERQYESDDEDDSET
jgi:hypothetical protein